MAVLVFLKNYWRESIILVLAGFVWYYQNAYVNTQADYELLIQTVTTANQQAEENYEKAINAVENVRIKYVPQLQKIKEFVRDENETACMAAGRLLHDTVY